MSPTATSSTVRVREGDPVPSVGLRASDGFLLNLRSFVTRSPVAIVFFAGPTARGAARQKGDALTAALAHGYGRLQQTGVDVVGVSCDSAAQQTEYVGAQHLPFLLMSDERRTAVDLLGIKTASERGNLNVATPVLLAVDVGGTVRGVFRDPDPRSVVAIILEAFRPTDQDAGAPA